jgi:hypothetical protein
VTQGTHGVTVIAHFSSFLCAHAWMSVTVTGYNFSAGSTGKYIVHGIILRAVQGISHYRVVVTIKYDQHSRTLISELTRSLKKQLDGSSSFVSLLLAVSPNSFKI